jgi:hypothetical protein
MMPPQGASIKEEEHGIVLEESNQIRQQAALEGLAVLECNNYPQRQLVLGKKGKQAFEVVVEIFPPLDSSVRARSNCRRPVKPQGERDLRPD